MESTENTDQAGDESPKLKFHFLKSNQFRVVHADGVWGGLNPGNKIQMAFYSQRSPLPQQVVHKLDETVAGGYQLGEEIKGERVGKDGLVRELEVNVIMDVDTARSLHTWLAEKLDTYDKQKAQASEE